MKAIECCAECAYYSMETHKCSRGAKVDPELSKGDDVRFFADCPLPDAGESAIWENAGINGTVKCSRCNFVDYFAKRDRVMLFGFCPGCGAKMREIGGGNDNG